MSYPVIHYERLEGGYRVFKDKHFLVANLTTRSPGWADAPGGKVVVWTNMDKSSWSLHWTSGCVSVDEVEAVMNSLPTEP